MGKYSKKQFKSSARSGPGYSNVHAWTSALPRFVPLDADIPVTSHCGRERVGRSHQYVQTRKAPARSSQVSRMPSFLPRVPFNAFHAISSCLLSIRALTLRGLIASIEQGNATQLDGKVPPPVDADGRMKNKIILKSEYLFFSGGKMEGGTHYFILRQTNMPRRYV